MFVSSIWAGCMYSRCSCEVTCSLGTIFTSTVLWRRERRDAALGDTGRIDGNITLQLWMCTVTICQWGQFKRHWQKWLCRSWVAVGGRQTGNEGREEQWLWNDLASICIVLFFPPRIVQMWGLHALMDLKTSRIKMTLKGQEKIQIYDPTITHGKLKGLATS